MILIMKKMIKNIVIMKKVGVLKIEKEQLKIVFYGLIIERKKEKTVILKKKKKNIKI